MVVAFAPSAAVRGTAIKPLKSTPFETFMTEPPGERLRREAIGHVPYDRAATVCA
jgi:hypothetical protein